MRKLAGTTESTSCSAWTATDAPRRVLVIRMHAIGDVAIILPAVMSLIKQFPDTHVDFLTTATCATMLDALFLNGKVIVFPGPLNRWQRLTSGVEYGCELRRAEYDVVFDLQRNWVSRLMRRMAAPQAWNEFDRFGRKAASLRVLDCFRSAGFSEVAIDTPLLLRDTALAQAEELLLRSGWTGTSKLMTLNPAGLWKTRQWPIENYVQVAREYLKADDVQFLLIGTERIRERAQCIAEQLGEKVVNLVERTTLGEALALLQFCSYVLTEDSGLMHMAWASSIPTVALLGSTNHVWSAPVGDHVRCFHSGDLECGDCMQPQCRYGDVRCLTRITPEAVVGAFQKLPAKKDLFAKPSRQMITNRYHTEAPNGKAHG